MPAQVKIKILDNIELRFKIDELYEKSNPIVLAQWSLKIAKRALLVADIDYNNIGALEEGFKVNELWQKGEAKIMEVRKVSFKIHKLARDSDSKIQKYAFRVVGQAVASGHMKEHAIVASDYAIKLIELIYKNDMDVITKEREWQLSELIEQLK